MGNMKINKKWKFVLLYLVIKFIYEFGNRILCYFIIFKSFVFLRAKMKICEYDKFTNDNIVCKYCV